MITIASIKRAVAERHHVSLRSMNGSRGDKKAIRTRQTVMYLARRLTQHSFKVIGKHLGGRHHTTVMHGYRRVQDRIHRNQKARTAVASFIDELVR